jgi:hypothetical protein
MIVFAHGEVALYYSLRAPGLRQHGRRWRGRCPIHRGKRNSFSVDPESGLWRCWSDCGRGGDIITLEIALTGASWREALTEIEQTIGRPLLDRPAGRTERRLLAQSREQDERDRYNAEVWRSAREALAEDALDRLPPAVPERYGPTQVLLLLRAAKGAELVALYRDHRAREPQLAAALVYAGERAWQRLCVRLARFMVAGAEVPHVA